MRSDCKIRHVSLCVCLCLLLSCVHKSQAIVTKFGRPRPLEIHKRKCEVVFMCSTVQINFRFYAAILDFAVTPITTRRTHSYVESGGYNIDLLLCSTNQRRQFRLSTQSADKRDTKCRPKFKMAAGLIPRFHRTYF
jgi:hypothetical protein